MAETGFPGLLRPEDAVPSGLGDTNVVEARNTGVLPYQRLKLMVQSRVINSIRDIEQDQIQPASVDLRLGRYAYRVRASFLPGSNATILERIKELGGEPAIDLENGATLEKGAIYVVELQESVRLTPILREWQIQRVLRVGWTF
jgi:dCTP deaminase